MCVSCVCVSCVCVCVCVCVCLWCVCGPQPKRPRPSYPEDKVQARLGAEGGTWVVLLQVGLEGDEAHEPVLHPAEVGHALEVLLCFVCVWGGGGGGWGGVGGGLCGEGG